MSFSKNCSQSSIAPSVGRQDVSTEAGTIDERLASSTSFAPSTFGSSGHLYHVSFGITEALGSESCDHNQEIAIFSVSTSRNCVARSAITEDSSVLHASARGKPVRSCTEQERQREIVDNTEAPYSVHSVTKLLPTVREEALASLSVFGPKAIRRLNSGMSTERRFPPPISSIYSSSDSTHVYMRPFKGAGRFVLQEVKLPCQNILRASRKNGRLTLDLVSHEKSNDSSSASSLEFESGTQEGTTLEKTSEAIPAIADCGLNKNCTETACSDEEDTGKLGKLAWFVDGSRTNGATITSIYSGETLADEFNASNVTAVSTAISSVMDANLETSRATVSTAYGPTHATTSATDQVSVRQQYDPGIVTPLVVF